MAQLEVYTRVMLQGRVSALQSLSTVIAEREISSNADFIDFLNAVFDHTTGIKKVQLADDLGFSMTSVYRWAQGRRLPRTIVWPTIIAWSQRAIEQKVNETQAMLAA